MRKNYSSAAYQRDMAFLDAVEKAMSAGLLGQFDISDRMHSERVRLLKIKSQNLFAKGGARISLDEIGKSQEEKPRYRAAAALRKTYDQARKNVAEYELSQEESKQAKADAEMQSASYGAIVEHICSGTVKEGGLVNALMQRDKLEADIAAARESPLLFDEAALAKKANDLDARIKSAVESCPDGALPELRKRAGYLLGKYYKA